jgi:glycosyltransferase involved in cell wall biosynthesis
MDVFAFASQTETQGLVLAEAMAAGVPVVAVDAPGVREVVDDCVNGRLLPCEDLEAFVSALRWVSRPHVRRGLEAGVARTADAYSINATGRRALVVYERLERAAGARAQENRGALAELRRRIHEEWNLLSHRARTLQHSWPEATY